MIGIRVGYDLSLVANCNFVALVLHILPDEIPAGRNIRELGGSSTVATVRKRTWESKGVTQQAWVVDYKDREGQRRFQTFKLKRQADAALTKIQGELQAGTHTPQATSQTVREAAELWYKRCLAKNERATMRDYRRFLDS